MSTTLTGLYAAIQARALPLGERLAGSRAGGPADISARLHAWKRATANGDEAAFAKRLRWDGLTPDDAAAALAADPEPDGVLAPWAEFLRAAYGDEPAVTALRFAEGGGAPDRAISPGDPLPFEELFLPLVREARARMAAAAGAAYGRLQPAAHAALERGLLQRLTALCARALVAEYTGFRAVRQGGVATPAGGGGSAPLFPQFTAEMAGGRILAFLGEYPVAARLCGTVAALWVEAASEFIRRVSEDGPALDAAFNQGRPLGSVVELQAGLSDAHLGGRSVLIPRFACGVRVAYKPRPIGMEEFFSELVGWINARGGAHRLRTLAIVPRRTHGWVEFAEHADCADADEAGRFYERAGMLLCLAHVLGAGDFHFENLIAAGEHPVLIDMEGLTTHRFALVEELATAAMASRESNRRQARSVLNTRMLPLLKVSDDGRIAFDSGALGRMDQAGLMEAVSWLDVNADGMRLGRKRFRHETRQSNLPRIGGKQVAPAPFAGRIAAGYRHTYRLLLQHRDEWVRPGGLLDRARGRRVRFILRDTGLYASLLDRCLHPRFLRNGVERGIELDALSRTLLRNDERPAVWAALAAERHALEQMDVPFFEADAGGTALDLATGGTVPGCFTASAVDEMRDRFHALDEADLEFQAAAIHAAYRAVGADGLVRVGPAASPPPAAPAAADGELRARLETAAEAIAQRVIDRGFPDAAGGLSWATVSYLPRARRHTVGAAPLGLADGYGGIALFLAALASRTGSARHRAAALAAFAPLTGRLEELERAVCLRRTADLGAATGLGSAVYALARAGGLLGDERLLAAAGRVAASISTRLIGEDAAFDVTSGSAGAILGLLALHGETGAPAPLEQAAECGRHLLQARAEDAGTGLRAWSSGRGPEVGMAHGQAGIALALRRLARASGDASFAQAADEAGLFEAQRLGEPPQPTAPGWAHGAMGVGMARLAGDGASPPEVEAAVEMARASLLEGSDDLCRGAMGRVDLLLSAGLALGRPGLVDEARAGAAAVAASPEPRLPWPAPFDAALHLGLSGVGYQLLRVLDPERIPSVLTWS